MTSLPRSFAQLGVWWRSHRRRLCELWAVGALASLCVTAASAAGYLNASRERSLDLFMRLQRHGPFADVVIVAIDDDAFEALGQRQPLSRDYLARIVRGLARSGAAVIALDVSLSTRTDGDEALAVAVREFSDGGLSRVVTVAGWPPSGPLADTGLMGRSVSGSAEVQEDSDGVVRRASLALRRGERVDPSFALAILARLQGMDQPTLGRLLEQPGGQLDLPVWRQGSKWEGTAAPLAVVADVPWRINFLGPTGTFLTIPAGAVAALANPGAEVAADNPVRGRIALVGGTFADSRDFYTTPYGRLSGVEIHANLVHMLGTRSFIQPSGWILGLGLQITLVAVAGALLVLLKPFMGTVVVLSGALIIGLPASYLVFERAHHWIDFLLPIFAMRVMAWGVDLLDRRDVRRALERWSRRIVGKAATAPASLHGERREVSMLRVVLRDFARESEKMTVDDIAVCLDAYREIVKKAVSRYDGIVHNGIGESILAVFGAPVPRADHALRAARAALAIEAALRGSNEHVAEGGGVLLRAGVVIHSGTVFAGHVGVASQLTVVGAASDLIARLDRANDELDTAIVITPGTRAALGDRGIVCERAAVVPRGGHGGEIRLWELMDVHGEEERG